METPVMAGITIIQVKHIWQSIFAMAPQKCSIEENFMMGILVTVQMMRGILLGKRIQIICII